MTAALMMWITLIAGALLCAGLSVWEPLEPLVRGAM